MGNAQDLQLLVRQVDAPQHHPVAPQGFDGVDAHAAHHLLDLVLPRRDQIHQPLRALLGIQPLDQIGALGGDAPAAPTCLTGAAQVAAHGQQRGGGDIAGVRAQGDGLDHIGGGADAAAHDQGHVVPDTLVPQPLIHGGQRQLHGDAHVVADAGGGGARAAAVAVDGDDVRAAAGDAAGNGGDVVDGGYLDDDGLFVLGGLLQGVDQLAQILDGVDVVVRRGRDGIAPLRNNARGVTISFR